MPAINLTKPNLSSPPTFLITTRDCDSLCPEFHLSEQPLSDYDSGLGKFSTNTGRLFSLSLRQLSLDTETTKDARYKSPPSQQPVHLPPGHQHFPMTTWDWGFAQPNTGSLLSPLSSLSLCLDPTTERTVTTPPSPTHWKSRSVIPKKITLPHLRVGITPTLSLSGWGIFFSPTHTHNRQSLVSTNQQLCCPPPWSPSLPPSHLQTTTQATSGQQTFNWVWAQQLRSPNPLEKQIRQPKKNIFPSQSPSYSSLSCLQDPRDRLHSQSRSIPINKNTTLSAG